MAKIFSHSAGCGGRKRQHPKVKARARPHIQNIAVKPLPIFNTRGPTTCKQNILTITARSCNHLKLLAFRISTTPPRTHGQPAKSNWSATFRSHGGRAVLTASFQAWLPPLTVLYASTYSNLLEVTSRALPSPYIIFTYFARIIPHVILTQYRS